MASVNELFKKTLVNNGFSLTKTRQNIFTALDAQEPQTMRQLISRVGSDADRASIYRTVSLFEKLGIVQRLQIGWKYKLELTDIFSYHHHHVSCVNCGAVVPLPEDKKLEDTLNSLAKEYGYRAQTHQLEIQGLCKNCQQKNL